jgi:anti-sigma regulatory factor (Ser/Thr protein kinase)
VTCSYAVYDPFTTTLCLADAGHLPPLIRTPDGETHELAVWQGIPLGVGGMPFGHCVATLPPNSVVAFYSDGVVERRDRDLDEGIAILRGALSSALETTSDLEVVADLLLRDMLPGAGQHEDDVTLLLVRTPAHQGHRATLDITREPSAVPNTRHFVQAKLTEWEVDDDLAHTAVLLATELVTNAVRHGLGEIRMRLRRACHALYIEVDDDGSALPDRRQADDDDEGGRGLQLVDALSEAWGARPLDHGKSVWCAMKLPSQAS